jgi:hypothetical protein
VSAPLTLRTRVRIPPPSPHIVKSSGIGFKDHAWSYKKLFKKICPGLILHKFIKFEAEKKFYNKGKARNFFNSWRAHFFCRRSERHFLSFNMHNSFQINLFAQFGPMLKNCSSVCIFRTKKLFSFLFNIFKTKCFSCQTLIFHALYILSCPSAIPFRVKNRYGWWLWCTWFYYHFMVSYPFVVCKVICCSSILMPLH